MRFWRELRPAAVALAPWVLAIARRGRRGMPRSLAAAMPTDPMRFSRLAQYTPC